MSVNLHTEDKENRLHCFLKENIIIANESRVDGLSAKVHEHLCTSMCVCVSFTTD